MSTIPLLGRIWNAGVTERKKRYIIREARLKKQTRPCCFNNIYDAALSVRSIEDSTFSFAESQHI